MSKIIGIDLGTTNSCTAFVSNKIPRIIPIEEGFNTMPSVVTFHPNGNVYVGEAAKEFQVTQPQATVNESKRLIGRQLASPTVQELKRRFRYEIVADASGEAAVRVGSVTHAIVDVQGRILQQIKRYAEIYMGEDIPEVVIAVPAYFNDHQRAIVKEAGKRAGWNVRRVVNEPTAAALAYGFNRGFNQKILIYDFGGGTFDVSILQLNGNVFEVIATGGDVFLGGADFDDRVLVWMLDEFKKATKIDLIDEPAALQKLRAAAERAKIELSLLANTQIRIQNVIERRGKSTDLELILDRDTLNAITRDLVDRSIAVVDRLLAERHLTKGDIDEIILVGGQTRMPLVVESITAHFGKAPRKGVHPDECVALGAALLGDSLAKSDAVTLLDALSVPIGIAGPDGNLRVVVDKHVQLPHKTSVTVPTTQAQQSTMNVDVFQGEVGPVTRAEYLGTLRYDGLPPDAAGAVSLQLDFNLDDEGMLAIDATSSRGGAPQRIKLATLGRPVIPQEIVAPEQTKEPELPADVAQQRPGIKDLMKSFLSRR